MAVQAQYPSNVLLLNRSGQEGNDYSLQPQPGGGFLDQSHMLFNNGGSNLHPRKRGRENIAGIVTANNNTTTTTILTTAAAPIINPSPFSMQTQPSPTPPPPHHQLMIDLSQLHNRHHNHHHQQQQQPNNNNANNNVNGVVSTGLHLSFGDRENQHLQQQNHHHYQQQQNSIFSLSLLSADFASHIKRQQDELDNFLQAQGEQLRRTLAEKRQRHYRALLSAAEESVARRLREKEAEVEKATRRNAELEARAAQLSVEAQVWQAKARAQEAAAASLQAQLQQAISSGGCPATAAQDHSAGGCGGGGGVEGQVEDAESAYVDPERVCVSGPSCKACRKRVASVVLLPCRHLCLCTDCDQVAQACPLCLCIRNSSVEVYLS